MVAQSMTVFVFLVISYVLALLGRIVYDHLKDRRRVDPRDRRVFALVFVDMCVLWASWFALCEQDPSELGLPLAVRRIGLGLSVMGALLFLLALAQLKKLENTTQLETGGLFRLMRHPIYTGFACWYIGWPLHWDRIWSLALGVASLGAVYWWRHSEERALLVQFGEDYRAYRERTWF